jgi:hypothetical protein
LFVAYLVAHAGLQGEGAAVFQFRHQLAFEDVEDVSSFAPVIGAVAGGVLDDSDSGVAGLDRVPDGGSGFAGLGFSGDRVPIGGAELRVLDQHVGIVPLPSPSPLCRQNLENKRGVSQEQL